MAATPILHRNDLPDTYDTPNPIHHNIYRRSLSQARLLHNQVRALHYRPNGCRQTSLGLAYTHRRDKNLKLYTRSHSHILDEVFKYIHIGINTYRQTTTHIVRAPIPTAAACKYLSTSHIHMSRYTPPPHQDVSTQRIEAIDQRYQQHYSPFRTGNSTGSLMKSSTACLDGAQASKAANNHPTPSTNHHRANQSQPNDGPASKRVHSSRRMLQGRANELLPTPHISISKHAGLGKPSPGVFQPMHISTRRDDPSH
jgi:hypothetical protein